MVLKLLSNTIFFLLMLCFFIFFDYQWISLIVYNIKEGTFFDIIISVPIALIPIYFTSIIILILIGALKREYKNVMKNHFLDTYVFPKKLYKILSEKYPHLKKDEVEEVLECMKKFYRFHINKDLSIPRYMPSHVVDFACQTFFDMPESSIFFEKLSPSHSKYHRILPKGTTSFSEKLITVPLAGQYDEDTNSRISEMWCYCCKKENIDPFFPLSFPSFFTLDKRLKIPFGFIYKVDETQFRKILSISEAPSIGDLRYEIEEIDNIDYLAKKIQYYLSFNSYCHRYQREELEGLFKDIEKNQPLAHAVYGQYSDVNFFKKTVLDNSAPLPIENIGCCSGASI